MCFLVNFVEFLRTPFLPNTPRATASGLVRPCLNSDLYFISKTSGTALLETIVSYKSFPSLKTLPSALLGTPTL